MRSWIKTWATAGVLIIACTGQITAADHVVQKKSDGVAKNGKIDNPDEEVVTPDSIVSVNTKYRITSRVFRPPSGYSFKPFGSGGHVDIWTNPEGSQYVALIDSSSAIQIAGLFNPPTNAGNFPLRGEGNLIKPSSGDPGGDPVDPPLYHWSAKMEDQIVNITIHHGQGGAAVPDDDEVSKGGFTAANHNDTDGDGQIDINDTSVKATGNNRDEIDLMQLVVHPPEPNHGGNITITIEGPATAWKHSYKGEQAELTFAAPTEDKILWVEANKSSSLRDIRITATYNGVEDEVAATGIWVVKSNQWFSGSINQALDRDLDDPAVRKVINGQTAFLGVFGPITNVMGWQTNSECLEWQVQPDGAGAEDAVFFGTGRRAVTKEWRQEANGTFTLLGGLLPPADNVEHANDGPTKDAVRDDTPKNDHYYAFDSPTALKPPKEWPDKRRFVFKLNADEFARLKFGGPFNTTALLEGSRCSDYVQWHSLIDVISDGIGDAAKWLRYSTGLNSMGPGHDPLSAP